MYKNSKLFLQMGPKNGKPLGEDDSPAVIGNDYLDFKNIDAIVKALDENEQIVFTCEVMKQNRFFMWQKRNLMLTTRRLCNLDGITLKRSIEIQKIKAITKSINAGSIEFIAHVEDEYDYRFNCRKRKELIQSIKQCFFA